MKEYSHSIIELARRFRRSPTEAEGVLWKHLRGSGLGGLKFKRQHRFGRYIVDFYCAELQLVVEVEGGIHDHDDQREYDTAKFNEIESHGLTVLRVKNEDVMNNTEQVLNTILSCHATSTPSANAPPSPRIGRRGRGMRVHG
jgi:very-short-patch-repair endonuclease